MKNVKQFEQFINEGFIFKNENKTLYLTSMLEYLKKKKPDILNKMLKINNINDFTGDSYEDKDRFIGYEFMFNNTKVVVAFNDKEYFLKLDSLTVNKFNKEQTRIMKEIFEYCVENHVRPHFSY
jgi:hypothetical protein